MRLWCSSRRDYTVSSFPFPSLSRPLVETFSCFCPISGMHCSLSSTPHMTFLDLVLTMVVHKTGKLPLWGLFIYPLMKHFVWCLHLWSLRLHSCIKIKLASRRLCSGLLPGERERGRFRADWKSQPSGELENWSHWQNEYIAWNQVTVVSSRSTDIRSSRM